MEAIELQKEIEKVYVSNSLSKEEKNARIKIFQSAIQSLIQNNNYNSLLLQFIEDSSKLVELTTGSYQIENSLYWNKISLKGMILDSELCKSLDEKGISYTLDELKYYAIEYSQDHDIDLSLLNKIISLYKFVEDIEKQENEQISMIARNLSDVLGNDIISKYNETGVIQRDGKTLVQLVQKTNEEIEASYQKAIAKIEELYVNEGILDMTTRSLAIQLVNQVFNNYKNGNKLIPVETINHVIDKSKMTF